MVIVSLTAGSRDGPCAGPGRERLLVRCAGVLKPRCSGFRRSLCAPWFSVWLKSFFGPGKQGIFSFLGWERLQREPRSAWGRTEQRLCRSPGAPGQERSGAAAAQSRCEPSRAERENSPRLQRGCFTRRDRARGARLGRSLAPGEPRAFISSGQPRLAFSWGRSGATFTPWRERGFLWHFGSHGVCGR